MFLVTRVVFETRNECQHTDYMSLRGKNRYGGLLRGSVVSAKFLLVLLNTLPGNGAGRVVIHVLNLSSLAVSASVARTIRCSF